MKTQSAPQEFFVAGGTLWREAPSYIRRPADAELFRLAFAGDYCNVLAARQMGKSSLMVQTANRLQEAGVGTAILDISTLGGGISTPEAWFFGFLDELTTQLGLDADLNTWWEAHANHNAVQRFSNFLRDVLLPKIAGPIVVFVDEIDSALGMAFTDDFFAAIRAAYNARASHPEFQRLTFILLGVARPADLIRDRNRTPYNIGAHIDLSDFTLPELAPFKEVFEAVYPGRGTEILEWVLEWTSGQPYLTQKLCAELIRVSQNPFSPQSVEQTVTRLFLTDEARKESNLQAIRDRIESSPNKVKMLLIYEQILRGRTVLDEERSPAKNELKLTGLVRPSARGGLEVRNRIYQTVFDRVWLRRNLPQPHTRQIAILTSLLAIVAFMIAGYAIYQRRIQPSLTYIEQFQSSNSPDVKLTSLARLLELDDRSQSQAVQLYAGLSREEKLSLFSGLSDPQNIAFELVTVIEAVYQSNENTPAGNELLNAMRTVLGQIGAAGAPSLKTEIEFWLKGRQEANANQNALTAASFYDSAWAESLNRVHPNYSVRFDRAMARIALGSYESAVDDLQAVWEENPDRQAQIAAAIRSNPTLAAYIAEHPAAGPAFYDLITPAALTAIAKTIPTPSPAIPVSPSPATGENPAASPYTGWITFGYGEDNSREIMIMHPTSGSRRQITKNGTVEEAPSFSPDNWNLVYASYRTQGGWELYAYDLHRGTERQLTSFDGEAHFPVWSPVPGDTRIVFEGRTSEPTRATNVWMLDIATGEVTQITHGGADSRPSWSPDGTQIIFARPTIDTTGDGLITVNDAADIYILNIASGEEKNLTDTPDVNDFHFTWSPDGEWIAYTSVRYDANHDGFINLSDSQNLSAIRPDGTDELSLNLGGRAVFSPSWSPDGRFIMVLVLDEDGQNAIWRFDFITENFVRLTEPGPYYHPRYSNSP
ncbi:MAG TPA: AAA-like domain-containing protein [Anaerolineales bacterium]|nr:AAA-like domain-containing protein [Anaerolineales bacterium]